MLYQSVTEKNIISLKKLIGKHDAKFSVFVGAGTSQVQGIKTWDILLEDMKGEFGASSINVKKSIEEIGHAETASEIYKFKPEQAFYDSFMSKQFDPEKADYYSLHIKILNVFNIILTTNYDASFEKACEDTNRNYERMMLGVELSTGLFSSRTLVYLHGNKDENLYVFLQKEYELYYPSQYSSDPGTSRLENSLRMLFTSFSLIFIGFSFDDKDFRNFYLQFRNHEHPLQQVKEKEVHGRVISPDLPNNYIIISEDEYAPTIKRKDVIREFGTDSSWNIIFLEPNEGDNITYKENALDIITDASTGLSNDMKDFLITSYKRTKHYQIKELGLNPIVFEGSNYLRIENILQRISMPEAVVAGIEEASHAK